MTEFRSSSITGRSATASILAACLLALTLVTYHWLAREAADLSYLLLTLLAAVAAARPIRLPGTNAPISAAEPLFFIVLLKFGGAAAIPAALLIATVTSAESLGRHRLRRPAGAGFSLASFARGVASAGAAGAVVHYFPATGGDPAGSSLGEGVLLLLCVSLARYLPQAGVTLDVGFLKQAGLRQFVQQFEVQTGLAAYFLTATTAQFVLLMVEHAEMYAALLSFMILTIFYLAYRHYGRKFAATERTVAEARRHAEEVAALHLRTIEALASAIAAKDRTGHRHAQRVLTYAEALGRLFDLPEIEAKALRAAALLHDIGKLAIPDHILNKPGQLNAAEMEKVKTHPVIGASILEHVGFPYPLVPAVRHHHEHWDGTGYPDGLRGPAIPLTARILAVADAFDSALHHAPFYRSKAKEQAVRMLLSESGRKYDPEVVRQFVNHLPAFDERLAHLQSAISPASLSAVGGDILPTLPAYRSDLPEAHYLDAIRSAHQEAAEMLGLAQALSSTLNLEETVSIVMARLSRLVRFDACATYLVEDGGGAASVSGAIGSYAERLHNHRALSGQGVVGRALAGGQVSYGDAPWEDFGNLGRAECPFGSVTAYPLVKEGRVMAVVALLRFRAEPCDAEQLRMLAMITPLASDAIHNALTYRRTEARALTDALTGLPNSRILHSTFEQERNRAERYNNRLAILMIDLDGFKQINDTLGHQAGDDVLRAVAHCLKQELRGGDTLLRYAGDEFVALLHHAEESGLDELLRRIQDSLAARPHLIGGREVRVSASIGYAIYGKDGRELEDLMHAADIAMYRNKTERKQRARRMAAMPFPPRQADLPGEIRLPS